MLKTHVSTAGDPNIFGMQKKGFFVVVFLLGSWCLQQFDLNT